MSDEIKKLEVGGAKATPITLDACETKIVGLENKLNPGSSAKATPISLQELWNRCLALEQKYAGVGRCVKINIGKNISEYTIPPAYRDNWEIALLNVSFKGRGGMEGDGDEYRDAEGTDYVGAYPKRAHIVYGDQGNAYLTRSGNVLDFSKTIDSGGGMNILFYKL